LTVPFVAVSNSGSAVVWAPATAVDNMAAQNSGNVASVLTVWSLFMDIRFSLLGSAGLPEREYFARAFRPV
jgi:hypothetical protein